jgi:hypothetical protein
MDALPQGQGWSTIWMIYHRARDGLLWMIYHRLAMVYYGCFTTGPGMVYYMDDLPQGQGWSSVDDLPQGKDGMIYHKLGMVYCR